MTFIIDRFEGEFAVIELNGEIYNMPRKLLPPEAKEGSVIDISVNKEETESKLAEAKSLLKDLFESE